MNGKRTREKAKSPGLTIPGFLGEKRDQAAGVKLLLVLCDKHAVSEYNLALGGRVNAKEGRRKTDGKTAPGTISNR